jgi:branched-chain amino acid transport system ATP-binding protein
METLKVEELSKNFGGIQALQKVSFSLGRGEKLGLIGPNGSGKTTLINLLGGQLPPTAGRIFLFGKEITNMSEYHRLGLGLARSFQLNNLFLNLSVLDNVLLALQGAQHIHFQMFSSDRSLGNLFAEAQELLQARAFWERRHEPIKILSYGEQRQMEVVLSLASKPKILLLDEPTAGLSIAESADLTSIINNLQEDTGVLICTHDMDIALNLADRIIVLSYGKLVAQGTPEQIRRDSKVREVYLGTKNA